MGLVIKLLSFSLDTNLELIEEEDCVILKEVDGRYILKTKDMDSMVEAINAMFYTINKLKKSK